ncbi:hypothetical protein ACWCQL_26040 [Streptomyces sp. NPDC002073]
MDSSDVLNGYRAVVTAVREDRHVEITWRTRDRNPDGSARTESAWMRPDEIGAGALSLGYAMTVAASQGLTCHTSLLYGHGANAFATYPGITRARQANHLWLPLDVVEDERTQRLLGRARTETEQLHRAVTAFAQYLRQSTPDGMVSDALRPAPEPAAAGRQGRPAHAPGEERASPRPPGEQVVSTKAARMKPTTARTYRHPEAEPVLAPAGTAVPSARTAEDPGPAGPGVEVPSWRERPYGTVPDRDLARTASRDRELAQDFEKLAAQHSEKYRVLAAEMDQDRATGTSRGARWAAEAKAVLDQALKHLTTALTEDGNYRAADKQATDARKSLLKLVQQREASWLALRLAGSSRKDVREMREIHLGEAVGGETERTRARGASEDARRAAWETLRTSPHTSALVSTGYGVPGLDEIAQKLAEVRGRLPELAQARDADAARSLSSQHGAVQEYTAKADAAHRRADQAGTEHRLRQNLAARHPDLLRSENIARAALDRQVQQQRQQNTSAYRPAAASYTPPSQQHRGPRL